MAGTGCLPSGVHSVLVGGKHVGRAPCRKNVRKTSRPAPQSFSCHHLTSQRQFQAGTGLGQRR